MEALSSGSASSSFFFSNSSSAGSGWIFSTPFTPSSTRLEKNVTPGTVLFSTYEHSTTPFSPLSARSTEWVKRAPA